MENEIEGAIPVLEIDGKDYSLVKEDGHYCFFHGDELVVQVTKTGMTGIWTVDTRNGRVGNVYEGLGRWFLYEGPLRTRHEFTFGQDNTMIKVAEVIIRDVNRLAQLDETVVVRAVAVENDEAQATTMRMNRKLHESLVAAIELVKEKNRETER